MVYLDLVFRRMVVFMKAIFVYIVVNILLYSVLSLRCLFGIMCICGRNYLFLTDDIGLNFDFFQNFPHDEKKSAITI
jgi:hypothetical protein